MKWLLVVLISLFAMLCSFASGEANLSLADYLNQVTAKHEGYKAAKLGAEGAKERSSEGNLIYSPQAFASVMYLQDSKPTAAAQFFGTFTRNDSYSLGVSKLFDSGTLVKLSYNLGYTSISGVSPLFYPTGAAFYAAGPVLEVTQSLWKNGFGKETRTEVTAAEAGALSTHYSQSYGGKLLLLQAELTYWRLALARETVRVGKENLERAQKMKDYEEKHVKLELADKAELLQANAAYELRQLELKNAQDEERAASREFNSLLGETNDAANVKLADFDPGVMKELKAPARGELRDDIKAAREMVRAAVASYELVKQKTTPSLDLYGSYALNGRDIGMGSVVSDSFSTQYPTGIIGVKFAMPLDFGLISQTNEGARKEKDSAEMNYHRKVFEQDREWHDLTQKLDDAKKRLELSMTIEDAQKQKLERERERQKRGRSTTYQVILFEQDYAQSQFARIQTQADILRILAQMKTFGGDT